MHCFVNGMYCISVTCSKFNKKDHPCIVVYFMCAGPPDPPQSLSIAAVADRKIAIKWTASFSFGTWLLYKTIVTNVATGNMSESNWTYGEMFTYYGSSDGPCNLYQFTVIAGNSAGTSGASQPLIATVPTGTCM